MDPPLRFRLRDALNAVSARFELELGIHARAEHAGNHFLVTAHIARTLGNQLDLPLVALRKARVHAKKLTGEKGGFVAAGAGSNF